MLRKGRNKGKERHKPIGKKLRFNLAESVEL